MHTRNNFKAKATFSGGLNIYFTNFITIFRKQIKRNEGFKLDYLTDVLY